MARTAEVTLEVPEVTADPRYVLPTGGNITYLVPGGLSAVPGPVRLASEVAERAFERARPVGAAYRQAKVALKRATPSTRDELTQQFALAEQEAEALGAEARDAAIMLARAIARHRGVWLREQSGVVDSLRADLAVTLDKLTGQFDALTREQAALDGLRSWPEQGSLVGADFRSPPGVDMTDSDGSAARRVASALRGNMRDYVSRDLRTILAELRRQILEP